MRLLRSSAVRAAGLWGTGGASHCVCCQAAYVRASATHIHAECADFVVVLTGLKAEGLLVEKMRPKRMSRIRAIGCNFPQLRSTAGIRVRTRGDDFQHHAKAVSSGIGSDIEWRVRTPLRTGAVCCRTVRC